MRQFEDDPHELVVETAMDGQRYGANASRQVAELMAEKVERIQKSYLQK
jgi:hypothetical protein